MDIVSMSLPVAIDWMFVHRDGRPFSCETVTRALTIAKPGVQMINENTHLYLKGYILHNGGHEDLHKRILSIRKENGANHLVAIADDESEIAIHVTRMRNIKEIEGLRASFSNRRLEPEPVTDLLV